METRYKETNPLWPYFTKHEMKFSQVLSYETSRWGHVCSLGVKWRHPRFISTVYWDSPLCTQRTHMPSSGSFVTMYLAELHFGNGCMEIGLVISSLHGYSFIELQISRTFKIRSRSRDCDRHFQTTWEFKWLLPPPIFSLSLNLIIL